MGTASQADFACRHLRRDGGAAETQVRICALGGPDDRLEYALAMVEDVSDRRRMEAQLRLADRMASMGTLAAGMANEINNPLAFVLANLEFAIRELRRDGTNQDVVAALEEAREGGARVREIVRDLKTFSRADEPRLARDRCGRRAPNGLEYRGRGRPQGRLGVLVKDVLLDRLQLGDFARHMLLAGRELVDAARYLLLTGGDARGDAVDALPHRVEIKPYGIELLLIGG